MSAPRTVGDFVSKVRRTIARRELLAGGERVLAAVSGGPDSLAMLHALLALRDELGLDLSVAHFDHRMRAGSEDDAKFVRAHAESVGLPVLLGERTDEPERGTSPEEDARNRRREFLERAAAQAGAGRIATGHTADDQAETVLMRLIAGTGTRGLAGIPPAAGPFVRPLIDVRREETEAFCAALGLEPRRDPTNEQPRFVRNAVRRELLPVIAGRFNRRAVEALARLADVLRDDDALLSELAAREHERLVAPGPAGERRIPVEALRALHPALQRRLIRSVAELSFDAVERVRALALSGRTGDSLDLGAIDLQPLNARIEYGFLVLGGAVPSPEAPPSVAALEVPGRTDLPSWGFRLAAWMESEPPEEWPDGKVVCVVDADRIALPLSLCAPLPGDRFVPLGMAEAKKIGDYFTDAKVPRRDRARVPLVVGATGSVVWVVGHRIDEAAKVTPATRRFLWMGAFREEPA